MSAGETVTVDGAGARRRRAPDAGAGEPFTVAYEDDDLLVVDKPAGVVVHPARGHCDRDARRRRSPVVAAGGEARPRRDRAPPGPRHVRPARRRALDEAHRALKAALAGARGHARVPRARRGPPAGADRHDRRADRPRPARAHAHVDRHRRPARRPSRTSSVEARCRARRCCACAWRPGARTRSASTCRRSGTRSCGDPSTGRRARSGSSASSCMPRASRSRTRSPARRSTSPRRCPPICAAALERARAERG